MDQKEKTTNRPQREAAEGRLRQALVGLAKAKRHAEASQGTEGRGTVAGHAAPSGQ
ncbi:hypothetical protein [Bosea sp. F3-2]|uniref:hypothetical protein n=1 Tax=Bosea sp. F3-2 TaxID=2599640 RepID=UPI001654EC4B|nr:hypothetical protein [Bosea sp. F3-2]